MIPLAHPSERPIDSWVAPAAGCGCLPLPLARLCCCQCCFTCVLPQHHCNRRVHGPHSNWRHWHLRQLAGLRVELRALQLQLGHLVSTCSRSAAAASGISLHPHPQQTEQLQQRSSRSRHTLQSSVRRKSWVPCRGAAVAAGLTCEVQLCDLITPQHQRLQLAAPCDAQALQLRALQQHLQRQQQRGVVQYAAVQEEAAVVVTCAGNHMQVTC
jgi:hypothetical protein